MKKKEFIDQLVSFCEFEGSDFDFNTILKSIDNFDSLRILTLIAFVDKNFNIRISYQQISNLTDFNSLIRLIGEEKFDND